VFIGACCAAGLAAGEIAVREVGARVRVEIDGQLFADFNYRDVARPYLYPIIGPSGERMTRDWPMDKAAKDATDHVHHKGLWFAHGSVNEVDFWSEQKAFGKTVHQRFSELSSGEDKGVIRSQNAWIAPSGTVVCTDERALTFSGDKNVRTIDYEITLIASHGAVAFGDTKEGTMSIRVPTSMSVSSSKEGHIVTSEGLRDGEAWGKRANWVDYWGPVGGKTVGVAMFDHPLNPGHPTRWHVRTYGLFAANPFGLRHFDKGAAGSGGLSLAAGERATFRYRFVFHAGDERQAGIAERYEAYCK
jgi:hypothetical protein